MPVTAASLPISQEGRGLPKNVTNQVPAAGPPRGDLRTEMAADTEKNWQGGDSLAQDPSGSPKTVQKTNEKGSAPWEKA